MDPIYINTPTQCIKSKQRKMVTKFFARFYTPFAIIIWVLSAMDINTCQRVPISIAVISCIAALYNAYDSFWQWNIDIKLITNDNRENQGFSLVIFASEFMIHLICIVLSFWWVDDLHTCLNISKKTQLYIWLTLFIIAIVLHIMQHTLSQQKITYIVKQAYKHVEPSLDTV